MKMRLTLLISTLLLVPCSVLASEALKPAVWVPLPAVGSSPETGFQYGAYVMRIFPQTAAGTPQNRLELLLQGTTNGQFQAYLWPNVFFDAGRLQVKGTLGGQYWPVGYFGRGNQTAEDGDRYADSALEASVTVNVRLQPEFALGARVFGEHHALKDIDETPPATLLSSTLDGGLYAGLGVNTIWDTRDNIDWPTHGHLLSGSLDHYSLLSGSRDGFLQLTLQGARYWPVADDVLAVSTELRSVSPDTPFYYLPRPTGSNTLRGADGNRWIAQTGFGLQAEYRLTLTPRWAAVGFADSYQVASAVSALAADRFHVSLGAGLRYAMTPDRFNIRLDVSWVDLSSVGFTITVGEAF